MGDIAQRTECQAKRETFSERANVGTPPPDLTAGYVRASVSLKTRAGECITSLASMRID